MTKKEAILKAALELLVTQGVHNTPMSQIAKAASTGMGTIYNHFANKEVLINHIYMDIKEQEETLFLQVDTNQPIKTQFENYLVTIIEFFMQNPLYFKFLQQLDASPIITEDNKEKGGKSVVLVASLLKEGQANRIIKPLEVGDILVFIGGSISSYLKQYLHNAKQTPTSLSNHIGMLWDGIKA